jgi:hypothetical protein
MMEELHIERVREVGFRVPHAPILRMGRDRWTGAAKAFAFSGSNALSGHGFSRAVISREKFRL